MKFPALAQARLDRRSNLLSWTAQIVAAAIFAVTLPAKLGADPGAVELFSLLGVEPYGRLGLGVLEAVAVVLLLVPRTAVLGGLLTVGLLSGAILAHLAVLGVVFQGDASLFAMAVIGWLGGASIVVLRRRAIPVVGCAFGCEVPTAEVPPSRT